MTTEIEINQRKTKIASMMEAELKARGYSDIEFIGISVELVRATAHATKDGTHYKLRILTPDNLTTVRRPHFRVTVLGYFAEVNGTTVLCD